MANYKQIAEAEILADKLKVRTGLTTSVSFDTVGNPVITVGTVTAGSKGAQIKILNQSGGDVSATDTGSLFQDIVGRSQPIYTLGQALVVYEAISTSDGSFHLTFQTLLDIVGEIARAGLKVNLSTVAHGQNPVTTGTLTAVASFDYSIFNPLARA